MTIAEVLTKYPEAAGILLEAGIHCVGCHMAGHESLEQGLMTHGLDDKKVQEIVQKINDLIQKEKK